MKLGIIAVILIFDLVFSIAVIVWNMTKGKKAVDDELIIEKKEKQEPIIEDEPEVVEPVVQPVVEPIVIKEQPKPVEIKKVEKPVVKKVVAPVAKPAPVPVVKPVVAPVVLEENEDEESAKLEINRVPFAKKLLMLDKATQSYYNTIYNYFSLHRKINPRVSKSCASFRFGRDLVAKITVRGKTMKLHLALDVNAYDETLYFQKDLSDKKVYQEVPFTVKVKSERALRRALELIAALAIEKGIEKKTRYEDIDALIEIKQKAKEN